MQLVCFLLEIELPCVNIINKRNRKTPLSPSAWIWHSVGSSLIQCFFFFLITFQSFPYSSYHSLICRTSTSQLSVRPGVWKTLAPYREFIFFISVFSELTPYSGMLPRKEGSFQPLPSWKFIMLIPHVRWDSEWWVNRSTSWERRSLFSPCCFYEEHNIWNFPMPGLTQIDKMVVRLQAIGLGLNNL